MKKTAKAPAPVHIVDRCTFTGIAAQPPTPDSTNYALTSAAKAAEANANAIAEIAKALRGPQLHFEGPMLKVGHLE